MIEKIEQELATTKVLGKLSNEAARPQGSSLGPLLWNVYQNDLFYTAWR